MKTVGWHTLDSGGVDPEGNPITEYLPPLDQAGTPTPVIGWAPAQTVEPEVGRVIHDIDLFIGPTGTGQPQDVIDLPDGQYEAVGWPLDWTNGPHGYAPGKVVQLKRVEG